MVVIAEYTCHHISSQWLLDGMATTWAMHPLNLYMIKALNFTILISE